jgi:GTP1/Obg family GTP-binding protein
MTLMNEITALREEIDKHARAPREAEAHSQPGEGEEIGAAKGSGIETLLAAARATVEELEDDIEKFPQLSALAAFGIGLALGIVVGRHLR